jgi:hypothetical protein
MFVLFKNNLLLLTVVLGSCPIQLLLSHWSFPMNQNYKKNVNIFYSRKMNREIFKMQESCQKILSETGKALTLTI